MLVRLTAEMNEALKTLGVESFHNGGATNISDAAVLEPPCSIKWMQIENGLRLGAFSYAVSGYFSEVSIGRYTSIGEQVQIGRSNHAMTWVSTSPFFYLREKIFNVGHEFEGADSYHAYGAPARPHAQATAFRPITIGHDVWIGHGAFILPGVTIGDGAVVGAMSVVTKDVPPYGIVAGNPATLKRIRLPQAVVADFLRLRWWRFAPWQLAAVDFTDPVRAAGQLEEVAEREQPYAPALIKISGLVQLVARLTAGETPLGKNLALGKQATQSSVSQWSREETPEKDATRAVSGSLSGTYNCHTALEDRPWWRVDLGSVCRISQVRIYNRTGDEIIMRRAGRFEIQTSNDDENWEVVFRKDNDLLVGSLDYSPFVWEADQMPSARFVRIQLIGTQFLHLDQVEIFGEEDVSDTGAKPI